MKRILIVMFLILTLTGCSDVYEEGYELNLDTCLSIKEVKEVDNTGLRYRCDEVKCCQFETLRGNCIKAICIDKSLI